MKNAPAAARLNVDNMKQSNAKRILLEELALLQEENINLDIKLGVIIESLREFDITS